MGQIRNIAVFLLIALVVIVLIAFLGLFLMSVEAADRFPVVGDYEPMIVLSGSMEPNLAVGGMVLVEKGIDPIDIDVGDVITFRTPSQNGENNYTTHRVTGIDYENDMRVFETKGDANEDVDSWVVPEDTVLGRASLSLPYVGYFVRYVKTPIGFLAFAVVPAFVVIVLEMRRIFKDIRQRDAVDV
ncbi:MAG: signal peptidase I [Thermoleophilia bacterium]